MLLMLGRLVAAYEVRDGLFPGGHAHAAAQAGPQVRRKSMSLADDAHPLFHAEPRLKTHGSMS
ncbi:MAG TPA: hypothetical protein DIW61_13840 [Candidatus Aminicenantes bacterium]|nr:hypothetical protein [Candidatus Aminicenantes bacterium]